MLVNLPGDETREITGRAEIVERQSDLNDEIEIEESDFPHIAIEESPGNERASAWLFHDRYPIREMLVLTRRGEVWGIAEHHIDPYEKPRVSSSLHEWADEDNDGLLDLGEFEKIARASHDMLSTPHRVTEPFSGAFDLDGNNFIDKEEIERFREYYLATLLPALVDEDHEMSLYYLDLDWNGEISGVELSTVREYLETAIEKRNPGLSGKDPMKIFLDKNGDGETDTNEFNNFFFGLTETLAMYPHPARPLGAGSAAAASLPQVRSAGSARIAGRRLAVVGIDSVTDSISEETVRGLVLFVENGFVNTGRVKVVDRKNIDGIIEEYNFQRGGLTDEKTAVEIGKLAGAEIIVTGTVSSVGSNYYLQLRLIDVATAEVVASSLGEAKIENEFLPMSTMAVERLF